MWTQCEHFCERKPTQANKKNTPVLSLTVLSSIKNTHYYKMKDFISI